MTDQPSSLQRRGMSMSEQCKERVYGPNSFTGHQCTRKSVKDDYCNQHHPETVEKRRRQKAAKFKYDREHEPLFLANKKIEQLTTERDEMFGDIQELLVHFTPEHLNAVSGSDIGARLVKHTTAQGDAQ